MRRATVLGSAFHDAKYLGPVLVLVAFAFAGRGGAAAPAYEAGVHYQKLPVPVETRDPSRLEVVEVFSYACIHCYRLQPVVEAWRQTLPADVAFRRLPLASRRLLPFARAYYTAEAMGVTERIHGPIFAAIHEHGLDMSRPEYLRRLFVREGGVAEADFDATLDSFGVRSRVRQAEAEAQLYRIAATPTIVVNGRYLAEVPMAGSPEAMFLIVNHLLELERAALESAAEAPAATTP